MGTPSRSFWTLSFSGAGHLMPYHLGVAKTLLSTGVPPDADTSVASWEETPQSALYRLPIRSVTGSSSGAIAATVLTLLPHRLEEYTERFLQDRGHAFRNLRELLLEEEEESRGDTRSLWSSDGPMLSICTTRCSDGDIELFSFGGGDLDDEAANSNNGLHQEEPKPHERLLKAVEASCKIPRSFHPVDMVALHYNRWLRKLPHTRDTYPAEEGISINGDDNGYVDGGIAAPFPPTPLDGDPLCTGRIVVSPIAGEYCYKATTMNDKEQPLLKAIRPADDSTSWSAPYIDSVSISGSGVWNNEAGVAVKATPSLQNLRVLTTAMGVVPSQGDDDRGSSFLRDWYERGQEDASKMLNELS
jgi:predicted acylesterase/phospholipase RssA